MAVGSAFDDAILGIAKEQHLGLTGQFPGFDQFEEVSVLIHNLYNGPGCYVQPGLDGASVTEWYTGSGVGTDQAILDY